MPMTYKLYTENTPEYRANVCRILNAHFDGFTLYSATGYYRGVPEESLVAEIVTQDEDAVVTCAQAIREANNQTEVLVAGSQESLLHVMAPATPTPTPTVPQPQPPVQPQPTMPPIPVSALSEGVADNVHDAWAMGVSDLLEPSVYGGAVQPVHA